MEIGGSSSKAESPSSGGSKASESKTSEASGASDPSKAGESAAKEADDNSDSGSIQPSSDTPAVGSGSDLQSASDDVQNDPENASEVVETQAEVAEAATGAPSDEELAEFQEMRERFAEITAPDAEFDMAASIEADQIAIELHTIVTEKTQDYDQALSNLENRLEALETDVTRAAAVADHDGQFMTEEQQDLLDAHLDEALAPATAEVETAVREYIETLDPVTLEIMGTWSSGEQVEFFETAAKSFGFTEAGQERIAGLMDGLAGTADDPMAEMAAELRGTLQGEDLEALDRALGLMAGVDSQARPEEAEARLEAIAAATGIDIAPESAFGTAQGVGFDAFSVLAGVPGGIEAGAGQLAPHLDEAGNLSRLTRTVGNLAGGANAVLGTFQAIDKLNNGDVLGAAGVAAGVASFALRNVAPKLAGPLGWASTAVQAYELISDQAEWANFRREALMAAMGDDPLQHVMWGSNPGNLGLLDLDPNLPPRDALIQAADQTMSSWATLDGFTVEEMFWEMALSNYNMNGFLNRP